MAFLDRRTAQVLLTTVFLTLVFAAVYYARRIILIYVIAILFAYLLDPIVGFLQRHSLFFRNLRGPAVVEVYVAFLILIALLLHGVVQLPQKLDTLAHSVPVLLEDVSSREVAKGIGRRYGWSDAQARRLEAILVRHEEDIQKVLRDVEQTIPSVIGGLLLVPILAIFFLRDGRGIANGFIRLTALWGNYAAIQALADELNVTLHRYIRTKVILAGLSLVFYCGALLLLRFPHAIALAFLGAVLEFIPVAGWIATAAIIISIGVLTESHWIWMAALLGMWRITQDYVNAPRIMGQQLEIHPLMSIFGLMVGWEIDGIIGVYLSVPLMAVIGVLWRTLLYPQLEAARNGEAKQTDSG